MAYRLLVVLAISAGITVLYGGCRFGPSKELKKAKRAYEYAISMAEEPYREGEDFDRVLQLLELVPEGDREERQQAEGMKEDILSARKLHQALLLRRAAKERVRAALAEREARLKRTREREKRHAQIVRVNAKGKCPWGMYPDGGGGCTDQPDSCADGMLWNKKEKRCVVAN